MILQRNTKHPNFILGLVSYVLLLIGMVVMADYHEIGRQMIFGAVILGALHWIISIINVCTDRSIRDDMSRYFWLSVVIMIPPLAGMIYYMSADRRFTL